MQLTLTVGLNKKQKAISNDILQIQKVDGSTLYDAWELSFSTVDTTSILKTHDIYRLTPLNLKASASTVYTNQ